MKRNLVNAKFKLLYHSNIQNWLHYIQYLGLKINLKKNNKIDKVMKIQFKQDLQFERFKRKLFLITTIVLRFYDSET